jgi:hypothetical protein
MFALFSKFLTIRVVFFRLFFWIRFETLKIFFDLWFCDFAQRTKRQNEVVWVINFSKIFLNFNFFFLTMILFLTSMNFKYVFQFFSIRRNDYFLRFFLNRRYDIWALKISKKLCAFQFFDHENRFLNDRLHAELNFFDKSLNIINVVERRRNDECSQTKRQFFAVDFLSSFFFFDKRLLDLQRENRRYWYMIRRLIQITSAFTMRYVCLQSFNHENQINDVTRVFRFSCDDFLRQTQIHMLVDEQID